MKLYRVQVVRNQTFTVDVNAEVGTLEDAENYVIHEAEHLSEGLPLIHYIEEDDREVFINWSEPVEEDK